MGTMGLDYIRRNTIGSPGNLDDLDYLLKNSLLMIILKHNFLEYYDVVYKSIFDLYSSVLVST